MRIALLVVPLLAVLVLGLMGRHRDKKALEVQQQAAAGPSVDEGKLNAALASPRPVLAEFYADWCPACRTVAPTLDTLAAEVGDQATVIRLNFDQNGSLGVKYHIRELPCFIAFVGGREVSRQTGELTLAGMHQLLKAPATGP